MPKRRLVEKGYSNKQLKQMVHGVFAIASISGSELELTRLGKKIALVHEARARPSPEAKPRTRLDMPSYPP